MLLIDLFALPDFERRRFYALSIVMAGLGAGLGVQYAASLGYKSDVAQASAAAMGGTLALLFVRPRTDR